MKIRFYLALTAAALVMTNCSQDEELVQVQQPTKGFTATIEGASRSDVNPETGVFEWTAGDEITVWNGETFDVYANSEMDVNTFNPEGEADIEDATKYAIYPAGNHKLENGTVIINLPTTYTYGSTNAPMLATIEDGSTSLAFKHLGGLMRFVVNKVPVGASSFVFTTTNNIITGEHHVVNGQIWQNSEGTLGNNNSVTISFEALVEVAESMVFFVPLPVGTYGEYTVEIKGTNVDLSHKSENVTNTIGRRTLLLMPEFSVESGQLKKGAGNIIPVTQNEAAELSGIQSVTIGTTGAGTDEELDINYTPFEGNAILNITDGSGETESQESVAKININPQGSTPIESLNLNTPTLTAELGAGTYGTVEALTANQTLIIGSGVTIETLILNGGALQVDENATIGEIIVKDEAGLRSAVANGGNVALTSDITEVSELLKVEKDLVLDLNGHTLAFTPQSGYPGIKNTAKLEVKNNETTGKITSTQVGIQNNGTLVINCDVETEAGNAINNVYDGETTINGGTYKNTSTDKALIISDNFGEGTPVLTINGGSFESVFTNISYNNGSTGAVNAGTFKCTGDWHNIYVGGSEGNCNVTFDAANCTFESKGVNIQVNNWGEETNKNTLNNVEYTGVYNIVYASTIASLTKAVSLGGSVALTTDITEVSELLRVEKDLVLDLNGHTLAFTPQDGYPGIKNTAKFEVKDSKTTGKITSTQVGIQNNGTLVINCDVETEAGNAINNVYDGETTINGGTYKNTSTDKALIISDNFGEGTPVLTINDGSFESVFTNVSYNNGSTGAVNAGTFKCTGGWHNIYVGGSEGGCNVTYDAANCTFESNGIDIQVNDWSKGNTNTVNNTPYTSTTTLLDK